MIRCSDPPAAAITLQSAFLRIRYVRETAASVASTKELSYLQLKDDLRSHNDRCLISLKEMV
jgi:hypothetical protein